MSIAELKPNSYQYLMASGIVSSLIAAGDLGMDTDATGQYPDITKPWYQGWVFEARRTNAPFRSIEGTGKGAICLTTYDSWATSSWHSSKFPNLHVAIYADCTRDAQGFPVKPDASDRALRIYEKVHPLFHNPANNIHMFNDLFVVSTLEGGGFSISDVSDGDGLVRLDQIYNITLL